MKRRYACWILMVVAVGATGCAESASVVGNGLSALVACALLWSTINLERDCCDEDG